MNIVDELIHAKEAVDRLYLEMRDRSPDLAERIDNLEDEIARMTPQAKEHVRELGTGPHTFGTHVFKVSKPPRRHKVDVDGLVAMATERDEIEALEDAEVLVFAVQRHMIPRLQDPAMRAIYSRFVTAAEGTPSVKVPDLLK